MNKIKKISIILVGTALVVFGLVFFVIKPLLIQVKHQSIKYQEKFALFERRDGLKYYLKKLEADIKIVQEKSPILKDTLLSPDETVDFVVRLEEIAAQTNNWQELSIPVHGEQSRTASKEKEEKHLSQEFEVSLKGNFPNLIRYLVHLENMKWLVNIDSLRISKIQEESRLGREWPEGISAGDVQTNLELRVFIK